jgi:predicted  nucleic acid-binding Zn ribbon protein
MMISSALDGRVSAPIPKKRDLKSFPDLKQEMIKTKDLK